MNIGPWKFFWKKNRHFFIILLFCFGMNLSDSTFLLISSAFPFEIKERFWILLCFVLQRKIGFEHTKKPRSIRKYVLENIFSKLIASRVHAYSIQPTIQHFSNLTLNFSFFLCSFPPLTIFYSSLLKMWLIRKKNKFSNKERLTNSPQMVKMGYSTK